MSNDSTCSVPECGRGGQLRRGWCQMHYIRWKIHGNPLTTLNPARINGTTEERFFAKVDTPDIDGCLLWTGGKSLDGYGRFKLNGTNVSAHRFAYESGVGPIPEGAELDHLCHTLDKSCVEGNSCKHRRCVNTTHLEPVTHAENSRRGRRKTKQ